MRSPKARPEDGGPASRRRFLKLLAAGSAAMASAPITAVAATRSRPKAAAGGPPPAVRAEINEQKRYVQKALETIRAFPLPAGSDPAFVFAPLEPTRGRSSSERGPGGASSR